jgi:hypothetical protein
MDPEVLNWNGVEYVPKAAFDGIGNELRNMRKMTMTTDAQIEAEIQAKGLTAPRVTPQQIDDSIKAQYTFTAYNALGEGVPRVDELKLLTIAVLVLKNGFTVTGESACASPANFDADLGAKIAVQNAKAKIWPLEGYLLKSKLSG